MKTEQVHILSCVINKRDLHGICIHFLESQVPFPSYRSCIKLSGRTSAGRAGSGADLAECVSVAGFFLRPQGAFPPGYYPLRGVFDRPAPGAPLIRGMATGP